MDTIQFGSYQIIRKIGAGGMADVYEAYRVGLANFQTRVALKCILPSMTRDERFVKMFINEAHLGSQLHHPNIIQIQDFNKVQDTYYIAMEYVEGVDLSRIIRRMAVRGLTFPATVVVDVGMQALAGLGYAHDARSSDGQPMNIIHRDVKPSNFIITPTGLVKVGDFGIAKAANQSSNLTGDQLKGTINYMSPEQIDGENLRPTSDLFSVAAIVFEMLTLKTLFDAPTMSAILLKIAMVNIEADLALVSGRYPEFEPVLRRALARDPSTRFQHAAAMADALRRLKEELGDGLTLRDFVLMHPELFEPPGTQPGEEGEVFDPTPSLPGLSSQAPRTMAGRGTRLQLAAVDFEDADEYVAETTGSGMHPMHHDEETSVSSISARIAYDYSPSSPVERTNPRISAQQSISRRDFAVQDPPPQADRTNSSGYIRLADDLGRPSQQPGNIRSTNQSGTFRATPPPYSDAVEMPQLAQQSPPVQEAPTQAPAPSSRSPLAALLLLLLLVGVGAGYFWKTQSQATAPVGSNNTAESSPQPAQPAQPVVAAMLELTSVPPGAHIMLGEKPIGAMTPTSLPLPTDQTSVTVTLQLDGYKEFAQTVSYSPGAKVTLNPTLVPNENGASILIDSEPRGARIFLEGIQTNQVTPATLTGLDPNQQHRLTLKLQGYQSWLQVLSLQHGKNPPVTATLVLEDKPGRDTRRLPSPEHSTRPNAQPTPQPVQQDNRSRQGGGTLILNTVPPDAEAFVDGRSIGSVPRKISIGAGAHKIRFVSDDGFKSAERTIDLSDGQEVKVVWDFQEERWRSP